MRTCYVRGTFIFAEHLYNLSCFRIISTKKGLTWYYKRKISQNQTKLRSLNDEKKKILENVMEKETYKKAKIILEKYAPEQIRKNNSFPVPSTDATTPVKNNSAVVIPSTSGILKILDSVYDYFSFDYTPKIKQKRNYMKEV